MIGKPKAIFEGPCALRREQPSIVIKVKDGHDTVIPVAGDLLPFLGSREPHNAQRWRIDDHLRWSQVILIIADNLYALGEGHRFDVRIRRSLIIRRLCVCQSDGREIQREYCAQNAKNYFHKNHRNSVVHF